MRLEDLRAFVDSQDPQVSALVRSTLGSSTRPQGLAPSDFARLAPKVNGAIDEIQKTIESSTRDEQFAWASENVSLVASCTRGAGSRFVAGVLSTLGLPSHHERFWGPDTGRLRNLGTLAVEDVFADIGCGAWKSVPHLHTEVAIVIRDPLLQVNTLVSTHGRTVDDAADEILLSWAAAHHRRVPPVIRVGHHQFPLDLEKALDYACARVDPEFIARTAETANRHSSGGHRTITLDQLPRELQQLRELLGFEERVIA